MDLTELLEIVAKAAEQVTRLTNPRGVFPLLLLERALMTVERHGLPNDGHSGTYPEQRPLLAPMAGQLA